MNLDEVQKGASVIVKRIEDQGALKERLFSFGVSRGAILNVIEYSLSKATMEVKAGGTMLALRHDEAKKIIVEEVEQ